MYALATTARLLTCLAILGASPGLARAACEQPINGAQLDSTIAVAVQAAGRDAQRFGKAVGDLEAQLVCLDEPISAEQAAHLHRMFGLQAFVQGQRDRTSLAFAAALHADPTYPLPQDRFPEAHPIARLYHQAQEHSWATLHVDPPAGARVWFDGVATTLRPEGVPTLMQILDAKDRVILTALLWPEDPTPSPPPEWIATIPPPEDPRRPNLEVQAPRTGGKAHLPLAASAGVAALAAGGCYAVALATAGDYRNNDHSDDDLERLRTQANTLVFVSAGLGTVAVGTGLGAAVAWPR